MAQHTGSEAMQALDEFDPFALGDIERVIATSEAQREVWLADALSREASLAYNESITLRLRGPLDVNAFALAVLDLAERHDALRSTIGPDGTEMMVFSQGTPLVEMRDLRDSADAALAVREAARRAVETPFDLGTGPLMRVEVLHTADDDFSVILTAHHIVCDGWSWGVIVDDLGALYRRRLGQDAHPAEPASYAGYVTWESAESRLPAHEAYWLGQFSGSSVPVLDLPLDRPRAAVRTFASRRADHWITPEQTARLRKFGSTRGASLFATLFAGFAALLQRLSGQDDLVVGVPAAGQSASGMDRLVGHCVNLLPVRVQVDVGTSVEDHLRRQSGVLLDAFEHQTLTFGSLLRKLQVARDPSRLPLVSVMFNLDQALLVPDDAFAGLRADVCANPRSFENFELFVNVAQVAGGLRLECQYNADLFDAATIQRWLRCYEALLDSMEVRRSQPLATLDMLAPTDFEALHSLQPPVIAWTQPALMHAGFCAQAARTPDAVALRSGARELTYARLDEASQRLASYLRSRDIGRGDRVGLCLPRDEGMLVALLGVLKAGATYVPLDPSFPQARLDYYAEDARLALLITASGVDSAPLAWCADAQRRVLRLDLDTQWQQASPEPFAPGIEDAQPQDAAYVIYTSGSTGKPKGVCVPHRSVANFLASMAIEPGLRPEDRLAAVTTLSFDIAVLELLLPLCVGARVVLVSRETAMDGNRLRTLLEDEGATVLQATPSLWRLLLDTDWDGGPGFKGLIGGEPCPPDLAGALLRRMGALWNMYGPTETTVWSTCCRLEAPVRQVSIGRPIANTTVWVLDAAGKPCPLGVPGEICIGGDGVALGYLDRPELTAERFVLDAWSWPDGTPERTTRQVDDPARLYRTGDRGRWRGDGQLEHLGRLDFQVKVRGYRIELGEIEAACVELPGVAQSVVLAREDRPGDVRLVAYTVLAEGTSVDESGWREALRRRLPDYMVPQHFVALPTLPLLPNGKIDRKALPAPDSAARAGAAERVPPRNETEAAIVRAMEEVLSLPGLGIEDDFFASGGHSLLAARLVSQLNRLFDLRLPLAALFTSPTAARLAAQVELARGNTAARRTPIVHLPDRRTAPATPMQERLAAVEQMMPGRPTFNLPSAHRLTGALDIDLFVQAVGDMVARQPSLRTSFHRDEGARLHQRIDDATRLEVPVFDLRDRPAAQRGTEFERIADLLTREPFDIERAPLARAALFRMADDEHVFYFMAHHLVWDGWSFDLLHTELANAYAARVRRLPNPLPPLAVTAADHAQWLDDWVGSPSCREEIDWWKRRFANALPGRRVRTDLPRTAVMSGEGASVWVGIDRATTERLREVARGFGVTLNMLSLGIYTAMMADALGSDAVVVGLPVRGRAQPELEPVMGFFNNMLPVDLRVAGSQSLREHLSSLRRELAEVLAHEDLPFELLATEPECVARMQQVGLYQFMFSFQDTRERERDWGGLRHGSMQLRQPGATEDLGLWLRDEVDGLLGAFVYNAELFTEQTATQLRDRFVELLQRTLADPEGTLAALLDADLSASGRYLRRLGADRDTKDLAAHATQRIHTPPRTDAELQLAMLWAELLNVDRQSLSIDTSFFDLGGNSLLAVHLARRIEHATGRVCPLATVFQHPTIEGLARALEFGPGGDEPVMLHLQKSGSLLPTIQYVCGVHLYNDLARELSSQFNATATYLPIEEQLFASEPTGTVPAVETFAEGYRKAILSQQPQGPYYLAGLSFGGVVAYETAQQLRREGHTIAGVILLDSILPSSVERDWGRWLVEKLQHEGLGIGGKLWRKVSASARQSLMQRRRAQSAEPVAGHAAAAPMVDELQGIRGQLYWQSASAYSPQPADFPVVLVRATQAAVMASDLNNATYGWDRLCSRLSVVDVDGNHLSIARDPSAALVAQHLMHALRPAASVTTSS